MSTSQKTLREQVTLEAACVVVPHLYNHQVVVMETDKHGGLYLSLPGGKVEPGESFREGASRELQEETGICVSPSELVELWDEVYTNPEGKVINTKTFLAPQTRFKSPHVSEEGTARWGTWQELVSEETCPRYFQYNRMVMQMFLLTRVPV